MPTLTLQACESFCSSCGVTLFLFGFIAIFIPRHFKLGVIAMSLANIFFVIAIVYPKKISLFCENLGFSSQSLSFNATFIGISAGLFSACLLYLIFRCLVKKNKIKDNNLKQIKAKPKRS